MSRTPRLEVIEAFIQAASAPSFRVAADRSALSPAAFSRRIQAFTGFVGRPMFERRPGGMVLTEAGRECLQALEPAYGALRRATRDLGRSARPEAVCLSLSHSLAVGWLIPRLERLKRRHPGVELSLITDRTAEAVRTGAADLGVCSSTVDAGGLQSEHLLDIWVTPMAAPALARELREGRERLEDQRLMAPTQDPDLWAHWAEAAGLDSSRLRASLAYDMAQSLYEAAAQGLGVAPAMDVTVGAFVRSGRLEPIGLPPARVNGGYRLVVRPSRQREPAVAAVFAWLQEEARHERGAMAGAASAPTLEPA